MATTNKKGKSGFDAPVGLAVLPKGTTYRKNKDGTITPVFPKKKKKTGTK